MRKLGIVIVIACAGACGFAREHQPTTRGAADDDPGPGGGPSASACDSSDPTLRFCVDFEAPFVDVIADLSASGANATVGAVGTMDHDDERAAVLSVASTMHVYENDQLDIVDHLALDMWIRPMGLLPGPGRLWMLDNHDQYAALISDHRVRCMVKDKLADSAVLPSDGNWHHVGCTYDRTTIKVFVDGNLVKCRGETIQIPTGGRFGLGLGARIDGSDAAPTYSERYVGGLDDVRVWARSDVDMCAAAGATGCSATCPP